MKTDGYYIWEPTSNDGNPYSYRRVWVSIEPQPQEITMQYQRRQIADNRRQRWEDTPEAKQYAAWFAGWERRVRVLKWATIVFAVQMVAWFILAWNDNPLHQWVFGSMFVTVSVPVYIIGWSVKEMR